MPCEVRVPGVGVNHIGSLARGSDLEVDAERAQGRISAGQLGQIGMSGHARIGTVGPGFARTVKRLHAKVIDQATQHLGQFEHMDAGSSIDVRRVFAGKEINAHDGVLPTVATCVTYISYPIPRHARSKTRRCSKR